MQPLFNFIKQHVLVTLLAIVLLVAVASCGQFNDSTGLFHAAGYASAGLAVLMVTSMFLGKEDPA